MKILFVGDYSGFHATLARELRRLGHQCTVVGDGSRCMDTERDIDLSRRPGLFGSFGYLGRVFALWPKLRDYDVVQLINPNFLHLRTGKIRYFFRELRANNPLIGLSLAGSDPVSVKACVEDDLFRYSEFKVGDERTEYVRSTPGIIYKWINGQMGDHCRFIYENVDCAVSALYEYHAASARYLGDTPLTYGGIPVDTDAIRYREFRPAADGKLNLMVGIKSEMELFKGTDRLLAAAREVERRHPERCRVTVARDLPFSRYMMQLEDADVVLDQLYSYTPATNALQAMAMGKIAVSGGEPEFYDFIGEKELRPVVNVVPDDEAIIRTLEELVLSRPEELRARSRMGREFVERHNAARIVAARFLTAWEKARK